MPLNIDWQQILLHLFNFIILAAGLSFLLFKPVRKFMAEREEKYKKAAEEHAQKVAETQALEKERQAKIAAFDDELAEREKKELAAAQLRKQHIIDEANEQAKKILDDSRKRAEEERQRYMAKAGEEISAIVVKSAEKLLAAESNAATDSALYDKYLALANEDVSADSGAKNGEGK